MATTVVSDIERGLKVEASSGVYNRKKKCTGCTTTTVRVDYRLSVRYATPTGTDQTHNLHRRPRRRR